MAKRYHPSTWKKTLIQDEPWILIDDWYFCPKHIIDAREYDNLSGGIHTQEWKETWCYRLSDRVAHNCPDGVPRAPITYSLKGGTKGKCQRCNVKIPDGIKALIKLEEYGNEET